MKLLVFFLACLLWLIIFSLMKIHLNFFYKFHHFESKIKANFRILFAHINVEVNIPKEMLSLGFFNMFSNVIDDITKEESPEQCLKESAGEGKEVSSKASTGKSAEESSDENKDRPRKKTRKLQRYRKFKNFYREILRHYITSWSKIIWIKRELHKIKIAFFSKINIDSFQAAVQIGGRDAAETGLLVGAMWAFFGQITSKLYRMFIVKKNNIRYNVVPRFDDNTFLCKFNCILSFKISHIIFTAYKFLIFILKNRRIRNYG